MKIDLPPFFSGEGSDSFHSWSRQFEVAVGVLTDGDNYDYHYELVRILPTQLNKAAFLLWDSLPEAVQTDYVAVKDRLKEAFGHKVYGPF